MPIQVGKKAPAFSLHDQNGEKVTLKQFAGKTVVLYFYPKDMTPGCTTEACDFRDHSKIFARKKIQVLGVSRDPITKHQKFAEKYDLAFPLLADEDGAVCEKYGVWQEKKLYGKTSMGIVRSTFVIDGEGMIQAIYPKVKVAGHVQQILDDLAED